MRIGVYGGAFDPPHVAHLMAVAYALATRDLDKVVVFPCWTHAFGKVLTPFEHRLTMTRLAFTGFDPRKVEVSSLEAEIQAQYTFSLITTLKQQHPLDDLYLIMGGDEWANRTKWHLWEELERQIAGISIIGRPGVWSPSLVTLPDISSSTIRENIRRGLTGGLPLVLPLTVWEYIKEHRLYRVGEAT